MPDVKMPCPLCSTPLDIRQSIKGKPYAVCNNCLIQIFVRGSTGEKILRQRLKKGFFASSPATEELSSKNQQLRDKDQKLDEMLEQIRIYKQLIYRTCPDCGETFQIAEILIKTSRIDGSFRGFKCPKSKCRGIVPPRSEAN